MAVHFPGLRVLRGFEAAGRLLNFSHAAVELGVTPAAISHQVRELEDQLGVELFSRTSRSMQLTAAGEILHRAARDALASLARGMARIEDASDSNKLKVIASASIAAKWLVPRIGRFIELRPDIDVRLDISSHLRDFSPDDADIVIRWGKVAHPSLQCERLFENVVFPVCSPALLRSTPLREPRDLMHHRLIHVSWKGQDGDRPNWRTWLRASGIEDALDNGSGLHFDESGSALQAAIDGQGVALGDSSLVADDLAAGRLVRPLDLAINSPPEFAYYVVSPIEVAENSPVAVFREWLLAEAMKKPSKPAT
ncbi:MAG: transcriptional regulator GcvA [Rhizobiaceae bacterium]|nr:transcriptional regulator GcvA [Rhizobiaceae bacterium]